MPQLSRLVACVIFFAAIPTANAQEEHVFLVQTDTASLTGFRVDGHVGIFTALHGVVEAKEITVRSNDNKIILTNPVRIESVNLDLDLAILTSEEIKRLPKAGLPLPRIVDFARLKGRRVKVIGHPIGITAEPITTVLDVRDRPSARLIDITPASVANELQLRNSPAPTLSVLSLQGNLLPGHSGAPVLDEANALVAIGSGGLKGGTVGHAWAVPFIGGRWEAYGVPNKRLTDLRKRRAANLFEVADPGIDPARATVEVSIEPKEAVVLVTSGGVACGESEAIVPKSGDKRLIRITPVPGKSYLIEAWYDQGKYEPFAAEIESKPETWQALTVSLQAAKVPQNVYKIQEWQERYRKLVEKFYPDKVVPKTIREKLREFQPSDRSQPSGPPRTKLPRRLQNQ